MCMWVRAMDLYSRVYKTVEPKRAKLVKYLFSFFLLSVTNDCHRLEVARTELEKMMTELKEKQDALEEVETKVLYSQTLSTCADFNECVAIY